MRKIVLLGGLIGSAKAEVSAPGICSVGTAASDAMSADFGSPPIGGTSPLEAAARALPSEAPDPDAERWKAPPSPFGDDHAPPDEHVSRR